ncbi:MAG: dihydropteroate synthase [Coriobacteriia bacterium]|nr:dihydropteroate synthase [Coriobacteriia bacterium]
MSSIWKCGRFEFDLTGPLVMGILNVTPDSFSDGGLHDEPAAAILWGQRLLAEGADILDIGGESTRPGAEPVGVAAELSRVRPVVTRFAQDGIAVSVDTRRSEVAQACVDAGASIINDVSGFRDTQMIRVAASCDAGVVVMHMAGDPRSMQEQPRYGDVVIEVGEYLIRHASTLEAAGVARNRIAIDPGLGFGKKLEHNIELLRRLPELAALGYPLVVGASRKSFVGALSGVAQPKERLGGSLAVACWAAERNTAVLRVHDVAPTVQALKLIQALAE